MVWIYRLWILDDYPCLVVFDFLGLGLGVALRFAWVVLLYFDWLCLVLFSVAMVLWYCGLDLRLLVRFVICDLRYSGVLRLLACLLACDVCYSGFLLCLQFATFGCCLCCLVWCWIG